LEAFLVFGHSETVQEVLCRQGLAPELKAYLHNGVTGTDLLPSDVAAQLLGYQVMNDEWYLIA
tara:strand:- start:26282 stop:26470 length:189 start_codon:yes stop_codon:yes gene_type:complete